MSEVGPINGTSPYSLTEFITITITALATGTNHNFQVNGDVDTFATAQVPEPASIMLFGGVLLCTAGAMRKKVRRS